MMFRLAYPFMLALWALVAVWLAVRLKQKPVGITFSMTSRVSELVGSGDLWLGKIPTVMRAACLVLLVMAAARPQLATAAWLQLVSLSFL